MALVLAPEIDLVMTERRRRSFAVLLMGGGEPPAPGIAVTLGPAAALADEVDRSARAGVKYGNSKQYRKYE